MVILICLYMDLLTHLSINHGCDADVAPLRELLNELVEGKPVFSLTSKKFISLATRFLADFYCLFPETRPERNYGKPIE